MSTLTATAHAVRVTDRPATGMKILLLGVFTPGSTDNWKVVALRRLGHRVVTHPYRDIPVTELYPQREPFDVVFVSKGVPLTATQFAHLATLGRHRLLWWPDPFENWNERLTAALRTGAWRCAATSHVVRTKICEAVETPETPSTFTTSRILEGCDCEGPRPEWAPAHVEPSLLHFGSLTPRRVEVIERVRAAGVPVRVVEQPVYGAPLQRLVLAHAAVLGINTSPDLYSNRVQTVLAMGGVIVQEDAPGLSDEFPFIANECVAWRDEAELVQHAQAAVDARHRAPASHGFAGRVFDLFKWERVMERAIEFARGSVAHEG